MKVYKEISLDEFDAWGPAIDTLEVLKEHNACDLVEQAIDDCYPDGIDDVELNDLLAYDSETVFEWAGINPDEEDDE